MDWREATYLLHFWSWKRWVRVNEVQRPEAGALEVVMKVVEAL